MKELMDHFKDQKKLHPKYAMKVNTATCLCSIYVKIISFKIIMIITADPLYMIYWKFFEVIFSYLFLYYLCVCVCVRVSS